MQDSAVCLLEFLHVELFASLIYSLCEGCNVSWVKVVDGLLMFRFILLDTLPTNDIMLRRSKNNGSRRVKYSDGLNVSKHEWRDPWNPKKEDGREGGAYPVLERYILSC